MVQPNSKKVVARIHKGEKAQAVTGDVHSIPLRVLAKHDHPDADVKGSDTIYILHYTDEGAWKVWYTGPDCGDRGFLRPRHAPSQHLAGEAQEHIGHRREDDLRKETFPTRTHLVSGQQRLRPAAR